VSEELVIERIVAARSDGAAIFHVRRYDGSSLRVVAARNVMPRAPLAGEIWSVDGQVRRHREYGNQLHAEAAELVRPSGRLIIQYLARGTRFAGIGQARAKKLWDRYGDELIHVLDADDPSLVDEILGPELARSLLEAWKFSSAEATVMAWLDRHGFSRSLAGSVMNVWGTAAPEKIAENPYRLLAFSSWLASDRAARALGIGLEDGRRLVAGVEATLYGRFADGHTAISWSDLLTLSSKTLGCSLETAEHAVSLASECGAIVKTRATVQAIGPWAMEQFVRDRVHELCDLNRQPDLLPSAEASAVADAERVEGVDLDEDQRAAVITALCHGIALINGGAGVGKTRALRVLCGAAERLGIQVILTSLAGRAAARLREATGRKAYTIAAFLNALRQERITLATRHIVIVDEASMLDLSLCYRILRALPSETGLVLVGDEHQLAPIGFGLVFHVLVSSTKVPVCRLSRVYRQDDATGIPSVAAEIRQGRLPALPDFTAEARHGVSILERDPDELPGAALDLLEHFGGPPNARIITPLRRGDPGSDGLNQLCHERRTDDPWPVLGEPVMHRENDYDRMLFNGTLGEIISADDTGLVIRFDEEEHRFDAWDGGRLGLAYAITVHKAQGSSFTRVIVPLAQSRLLDRAMLYTAITRSTDQVVLVGRRSLLEAAVRRPPASLVREVGLAL
jgi:exodeoxyribonuclease V alpha subunit